MSSGGDAGEGRAQESDGASLVRRLPLTVRALVPVAVFVVAALALAVVLRVSGGDLRAAWGDLRAAHGAGRHLVELERAAYRLHREVKSFLDRPDEARRTVVEEAKATFTGALWRAQSETDPQTRDDLGEFSEAARRYLFGFDDLRGLEIDVALLYDDEFADLVVDVRERLDALDAAIRPGDVELRPLVAAAYDRFAEFRVQLVAYRRDRDHAELAAARVARAAFDIALAEIGASPTPDSRGYAVERFQPLLGKMDSIFDRLDRIADRRGRWLAGYVDGNRIAMLDALAGAVVRQSERERDATTAFEGRLASTIGRVLTIAAIASGLALLAGLAVAASLGRPLAGLRAAMGRVVGGDAERPVGGLAAKDAIGETARALELFRREVVVFRRAEAAQAAAEARWHSILETSPIAIAVVSAASGAGLFRNRRWDELFGPPGDDEEGLRPRFAEPAEGARLAAAVASGDGVSAWKAEMVGADGRRWWALMEVRPIEFSGRPALILWVYDDTERRRAEDGLRAARDRAEAALADLAEAQRSLIESEKLAALGGLVAGVAHEVNNPVGIGVTVASTLAGRAEAFAAELAGGQLKRSRLEEFVAGVRDAAGQLVANLGRAADLVQSFRQVAVDRTHAERRLFDLASVTDEVVASLRPGLRATRVAFTVEVEVGLGIDGYPGAWGQVVTNLFVNALTHAFPDGEPGQITLTAKGAGADRVAVVFADDGVGMPSEVARRAFEPFFTTRRGRGGSGLGLNIVYNIVTHRLGGRITLTSRPGEGSRFLLDLPRVAPREGDGAAVGRGGVGEARG